MRLTQEVEEKIKKNTLDAYELIDEFHKAVQDDELWLTQTEVGIVLKEINDLRSKLDMLQDSIVDTEYAVTCECGDLVKGDCNACAKAEHEESNMREEALRS